ncbi:hypothetical protein Zmor_001310 [Zophobas morio]|uniref:Uncharacterized protein n=1 Tax=Zophobas morio TaxID=2755281 RepID=A0AA38MSJ3_9CUCU|nr:hypothetical protein Zmor_001310 [Zophobas morio]
MLGELGHYGRQTRKGSRLWAEAENFTTSAAAPESIQTYGLVQKWKETKTTKREVRRRVCWRRVSRGQFDLVFLSSKTSVLVSSNGVPPP